MLRSRASAYGDLVVSEQRDVVLIHMDCMHGGQVRSEDSFPLQLGIGPGHGVGVNHEVLRQLPNRRQPLAGTNSCEAPHFQYHVSGVLRIRMDDGTEFDCKPGDVSLLPSGHDAWVVGDEPAVVVDFQGMLDYARAR